LNKKYFLIFELAGVVKVVSAGFFFLKVASLFLKRVLNLKNELHPKTLFEIWLNA